MGKHCNVLFSTQVALQNRSIGNSSIVEQQTDGRPPALDGAYEREGEKSLEILVTRLGI
jgi:hypothetical protein